VPARIMFGFPHFERKKIRNWRGVQVIVYIIITIQMKGKETFFMD
jgi:hypothetical protein